MRKFKFLVLSLFVISNVYGQNVQKDNEIGEEANKQIIAQIGIYNHPSKDYLSDVGNNLVSHIENKLFDYTFAILDMDVPNAMALPGGYVYFSRSIMVLANSEDELAGVMGHEITHVHNQHSRKSKNRSIFTSILLLPAVVLSSLAPNGELVSAPFTASYALLNSGYSRSHEKEADKKGAALAAETGYDPNGLKEILHKISLDVEIETGEEEKSTWFDSHPYTPKRVGQLDKLIPKLSIKEGDKIAADHKEFIQKMEGICIGDNPEVGVFQDGLFLHPTMKFTFAMPKGWKASNTPSAVGFMEPDKKSQLVFSLADTALDPTEFSKNFLKEYYKSYSDKPKRNEKFKINGYPAHLLSFEQVYENKKMVITLLWLNRDGRTYQFAQIGEDQFANQLENMAQSFHVMTEEERNSIYQTVLHVVQASDGETLEELSKRTNNVLEMDYTALINNLGQSDKLSSNRWVKIGIKVKY